MFDSNTILLLSSLGLIAFSVYLFTNTIFANNLDSSSMNWDDEQPKSKSPIINISKPLVRNFTLQHAQKIKNVSYRKKIEKNLLTAGLSKELTVDEYIGMQILWGIMFPCLILLLNFALQLGFSYILCIALGFIGFYLPAIYCKQNKTSRYNSVIIDLPFFIDLLALSTEAGLDFINAIQRVVDKAENSVLANELSVVLKDIKLGSSRADAIRSLGDRLDMAEIASFCSVIIDADYTGASISQVLKDQSIQMRLDRFVRAEKAGSRASQAILIPMMIFILPAVFVMVFAPVGLQFFYGGQ